MQGKRREEVARNDKAGRDFLKNPFWSLLQEGSYSICSFGAMLPPCFRPLCRVYLFSPRVDRQAITESPNIRQAAPASTAERVLPVGGDAAETEPEADLSVTRPRTDCHKRLRGILLRQTRIVK